MSKSRVIPFRVVSFIVAEIVSIIVVLIVTILICHHTVMHPNILEILKEQTADLEKLQKEGRTLTLEETDYYQKWLAALTVLGALLLIAGFIFGFGSVFSRGYDPHSGKEVDSDVGVVGGLLFGIPMLLVIFFLSYVVILFIFAIPYGLLIWVVNILKGGGINLRIYLENFYPPSFVAIILGIAIYKWIAPHSCLATKATLLITGLINFGILYGLPRLI